MKKLLRKLLPAVGLCLFALPANADYYLVGQPNGWTIDSSDYVLKETTSGSGIYEGTYYINGGAFQFRFYSALGNWDSNSIGAQSADSPVNITMTNGSYTGSYVSGKGSWQISSWAGGNVKMTIDTTTSKVTFEEVVGEKPIIDAPDVLYLIGNYEGGAFALNTGLEMQKSSDGQVFTLQNVVMTNSGSAYFAFTSALDSWDNINKTRIAPAIKDSAIELDEPNEFSYGVDASWSIPDGIYDFTVNFTEQAVYVTGSATAPDAMYLVGNFNDWTASDANYILTKQEDNTYVGTYNLPATIDGGTYNGETPIFKVYGLTWIGTSESTSTDSGGAGNLAVELTSGVEKVLPTSTSADAANWYLENWEGGDITFTYNYDDQTLTLLYVEPAPQAVYVLGEFNSWENNDDYKLEFSGDSIYEGEVYIPAGEEVAFRLFGNKSIGASEANYSITLNGEEELSYVVGSENNWVLKNWIGGTISFNITLEDGEPLVLDWTAPNMYLVGDNINGQGNWNTNFAGTFNDGVYTWNIDQLGTSFKISDDPTNWEGSYNIGAENDESTLNFGEAYTYFNNGNSKNINFSDARYHLNEATVTLNLLAGTLTVNGTQELNEITAVYVAGSFNE